MLYSAPRCVISIGMVYKRIPYLGVIYNPMTDEVSVFFLIRYGISVAFIGMGFYLLSEKRRRRSIL
jgi:hypothetical protein